MKRNVYILLFMLVSVLIGCGKNKSDAATIVDEMILNIGDISLDSVEKIEKAERYYEALTSSQKEEVENYLTLIDARDTYESLYEKSKVTIELTPENFEEYFVINIYCTDFIQGTSIL